MKIGEQAQLLIGVIFFDSSISNFFFFVQLEQQNYY